MAGLGHIIDISSGERMSIGIQSGEGLTNSTGLAGIDATGVGIQNTPTAAPIHNQQNLADDWLKPDLQAPLYITPWGEFNVGPTDWASNLRGAYAKTQIATEAGKKAPSHMSYLGGVNKKGVDPHAGMVRIPGVGMGGFSDGEWVTPPSNITGATYTGEVMGRPMFSGATKRTPVQANLSFKDPNQQRYIDGLSATVDNGAIPNVRPTAPQNGFQWVNRSQVPPDHDGANVAALNNANVGAEQLQAIADKYGVSIDEVQNVYSKYNRARQDIIDPVGANWQNIKAAPFYKDLEAGIRQYTNYQPTKKERAGQWGGYNLGTQVNFDTLRAMNPTAALSPEYFALHSPNDANGRNPYRLTDAYDYLDNGKTLAQSTQAERDKAQSAYAHQMDLLDNTVANGGPFDYKREYINAGGKKPKGYNWRPDGMSKKGYNEALDISQNYLQHATNGEKNYHDVGYSDATAARALFEKKKVKKGFLGKLGPLAALASFIPGPIGIAARVLGAANSAVSGNPLGAITSALGFLPGVNGTGLNAIGAGAGKLAGGISSALDMGKFGDIAGKAIVGGGLGALSGAASGHALEGAISGIASPAISGAASSAGFSPGASALIGSGATGIGNMAYNYNKSKQVYEAAMRKQKIAQQQKMAAAAAAAKG